jgi:SAM-dependent methyltransferase
MAMPSLLRRSLALLRAPANQLAFAARSQLRWSRGTVELPTEGKDGLFDWLEGAVRREVRATATMLERRYDLGGLRARSTQLVFAENLALVDRLAELFGDLAPPTSSGAVIRALDVGCGVFQYASGLQRWLAWHAAEQPRAVTLRGIEIDGFGVYRDGYSRADHARAHAALAGNGTTFEVADFAGLSIPPQDLVTMFYPFLSAYPLLRWGSPISHLRPRRLLRAAVAALRPGGQLVVANQTETEFGRLAHLLAGEPVELVRRSSFGTRLVPYGERTLGRIGSLWHRRD